MPSQGDHPDDTFTPDAVDAFSADAVVITFHGVRGSTPCCAPELQRYGGNTSCVSVESPGRQPIVFDLGTGLRSWGRELLDAPPSVVHAFVTHLHWDHVQGLPFFAPLHRPDVRVEVHGPGQPDESFGDAFGRLMQPPFFPVRPEELHGDVVFHDAVDSVVSIEDATVTARSVPHVGSTNGYRVDRGGRAVAYVSDHQQPLGRPDHVDDGVLELCDGADVIIHDAQFTAAEFRARPHWGHCTVEYSIEVARQAGAGRLVLFHHDPCRSDDLLDDLADHARAVGREAGLDDVITAAEGMKLVLDPV